MENACVDKKKYGGKYIATETFTSTDILSSGKDPVKVYEEAIEKGIREPVLYFIHKEDVICLY